MHAHFAESAGSAAYLINALAGIPYSITVHAYDIFLHQIEPQRLHRKLKNAERIRCISEYNRSFLREKFPDLDMDRFASVHCGVNVNQYTPSRSAAPDEPHFITVTNFVEKKGLIHLLEACRILRDEGMHFRCTVLGDGPLRPQLETTITRNTLGERVSLPGVIPNDRVREALKEATLFVLPSVEAADGDRDGIPVVLMEAMASGVPVVTTRLSGIPELVHHGVNGILVEPGDSPALARALEELSSHEERRREYAQRGRETVVRDFNIDGIAREMKAFFGE